MAAPVPSPSQSSYTTPSPKKHAASSFIADCSARLHLGHVPTSTAMVLAHRYFATHAAPHSFPQHVDIGAACIFLATKITEKPRKLRDVMNVAYCVAHNVNTPVSTGHEYSAFKERLLDAEQHVLRAIRFDMDVPLPYQHLLNLAKLLQVSRVVVQIALTLASDLFYSARALEYPPHVIAASSIYLAMDLLQVH
ncbi:hypothetical protein, variant [Aphanomyces astaci]|uniref:Cyclin N-terminal domain-containing protein n=1 Tax=Aphanomyces astaci TaxID=112090 RepID=W4GAN4_APHAT|nr:hypothetical protein, variant [Aphanomyces astaci]ETV76356.1 hypothetical protein, variant [Aphanomyces astaci]|eukprot:XP_009833901.1 hypothetical protein, variant [Aphanomyces astaci]